jgi:hypothetical protein
MGLRRLNGSIPSEMSALTSLRLLDLNGNSLVGSLPASLSLIPLEMLRIGENAVCAPLETLQERATSLLSVSVFVCVVCVAISATLIITSN